MDKIQEMVIEKGRRNRLSRLVNARNDKTTIAAWKFDLNRILSVFNVRSITCLRSPLIVGFQAELAINTNVVVSDVHQGVENTQAIISELQHDVASTRTIVSDIHRTMVEGRERADDKNLSVGATGTQTRSVTQTTDGPSVSYLCLAHLVNPRPHRRGLALDAMK